MPPPGNSLFRSQSISALHRQQPALGLVVERVRFRPFFPAKFLTFQSATARTAQMRSPLRSENSAAVNHNFSRNLFQDFNPPNRDRQSGGHLGHRIPVEDPPQFALAPG